MTNQEYELFVEQACHDYQIQNDAIWEQYGLDEYDRFDYDQETGQFTFSVNKIPKAIAQFQVIGSLSTRSNTWLWAWANTSIWPDIRTAVERTRTFGQEHGIDKLTSAQWAADEADGWAMTALTARLTQAQACYRCPLKNGFLYITLSDIRQVPTAA